MIKRNATSSISEDNEASHVTNENGRRPSDDQNNDRKKRLKTKSLYRQPTVNELNRLQETENLFNSNLFRLQVEEILDEVKVKEKTEKKFLDWFTEIKNHLLSIPEDNTVYDLNEKTLFKKLKVKLPLCHQLKSTKCIFKFYKFNDVNVVGSYALGCPISSKLVVDLQIAVPAETYTKNDSINYRYHMKRAAYLAYVTSHLKKLQSIDRLQYSYFSGSEEKPVLDIIPAGKLGSRLSVRINLVCDMEAFKLHRFSLERNNLREAWLFNENSENNTDVGPPTPYYNSSVLCDLTADVNQVFLDQLLGKSDNLKQAIVLLKIWLRQRDLQVSGHIVSLLVAYFVQTKRINNVMSSYQIVRNIWIALKTSQLDTKGISLHKGVEPGPSTEDFLKHFPVVFLDKTGYYNLCWQMCRGTYNALRRECTLAVDMLDNPKINSFMPLFMIPVKSLSQFDHILRFKDLQQVKEAILKNAARKSQFNYGVAKLSLVTDTIYSLLSKGLGNRVDLILQLVESDFSWPVKMNLDKVREINQEKLAFGFILNPENSTNVIEKGPPANLPEAEQFRAFWGDKSELRRFQDGSITETCVWSGDTAAERRTITKQIIDYLMQHKFGIKPSALFHVCDQLDSVTALKRYAKDGALYVEEGSLAVLQAFDSLRRDLRQLTQLPLNISAVYGLSPVFSYSSPVPPRAGAGAACGAGGAAGGRGAARVAPDACAPPEYTPVCKAVLELGHSGKWPGDLQAFRCLKAAFHLQISERLNAQYSLPTQAYPTHVDVLKDGLVFRLEISHPKEITLLRRETTNGVVKYRESDESVRLQCETVLMPRLRGALHGLHQKYPSYGPTACLLARWLAAHLLSPPHFPHTVVELMAAAVYLHAEPLKPPTAPTVGLIRVLRLLAEFDWTRDMIVLDFNEEMSREEITGLEQKFNTDPGSQCLRIVTAYDGSLPAVWSAAAPSVNVLARARRLAASAMNFLEGALMRDTKDNVLGMFVPSLSGYDVLIRLHPPLVPHYDERVDKPPRPTSRPGTPAGQDVIPVVDFHPVMTYLDELRRAYDEFALFFHDLYGGDVIAVLWKPDIQEYREFTLTNANALKPVTVDGETRYRVNTEALIEDFRILGTGLVKDIIVST